MKAKQTIGRMIMGCALALSLTLNIQAQVQKSPPGTYHSAKDPDLVPLPFNPHPELETVEVSPGIFVYDDTGIPDTQAQIISRKIRKAAAERAKVIASDPVLAKAEQEKQQAAQEGARLANFQAEFAPWLHHDERTEDGTPVDETVAAERQRAKAEVLGARFQQNSDAQRQAVDEFVRRTGQPGFVKDTNGGTAAIVGFVGGVPDVNITFNRVAGDTISADEAWPGGSLNLGLTGTNTFIGHWDGGDIRISHREFSTNGVRVVDMDGASILGLSDHGTHVAGTLNAYGVDTNAVGMSRRAVVLASDFIDDYFEMFFQTQTNSFRISNHSYGKHAGWSGTVVIGGTTYPAWYGITNISQTQDFKFGFYDGNAQNIDIISYFSPYYLQVWAAGNERGGSGDAPPSQPVNHGVFNTNINNWVVVTGVTRPRDGDTGGYDLLTQPQCAKNNLVIGAVSNILGGWNGAASVGMSTFSSFGPTDDGRIKPDVVADGVNLWSTGYFNDADYYLNSGTSMASPSAAGALNLLVQLQNQLYGTNQPMLASTQRGLAIHTADEAGSFAGPDYRFGWGLLNIRRAAELMTNNFASGSLAHIKPVRLVSGGSIEFTVKATNTQPLKISVLWTDPAGTPPALSLDPTNRMLVNDVDLRVIAPNGTTNFPWVLDPVTRTNAATTGDNVRDNVEQVFIASPTNGFYTARVTHKGNLLNDSGQVADQWVSIPISGNIPQPQLPLLFTSIAPGPTNTLAFKWNAEVGRIYQLQYRDNVASGTWQTGSSEISATKTNVAFSIAMPNTPNRFFRLVQLR